MGGENAKISTISKQEERATYEVFVEYFDLQSSKIEINVEIGDNSEAIETVLNDPHAIAYVSIGAGEYEIVHGTPIKLLPINGVDATIANVQNGTFPILRTLNFITASPPTGIQKDFLEFATSDRVSDLVREQTFIPIAP